MEPGLAMRPRGKARLRTDGAVTAARPLVRSTPRSGVFFPLVVLVAVLPGLYALNSWDLTPPGPWWGLRGLAVLDGWVLDQVPASSTIGPATEARAFRTVAFQPPLYAWLEAIGLALSADREPCAQRFEARPQRIELPCIRAAEARHLPVGIGLLDDQSLVRELVKGRPDRRAGETQLLRQSDFG